MIGVTDQGTGIDAYSTIDARGGATAKVEGP